MRMKKNIQKTVETGGVRGLVKKCNNKRQSICAEGSLSEVGFTPPHNSYIPHALVDGYTHTLG